MSKVKICPKCGHENDQLMTVCSKCNASLEGIEVVIGTNTNVMETNSIAALLKVIAIITYVGAFILGIALGRDNWGDFYFEVALIYWAVGFVSGSMFLGFSEIVRLLHEINQKK